MNKPVPLSDVHIETLRQLLDGDIQDFVIAARIGNNDRVLYRGAYSTAKGLLEIAGDVIHNDYVHEMEKNDDEHV
ncbi:MAG: hypothetical protein IH600_16445 [Bacteroidetes bacterium]|nr:hypothetical protein [Bacteroidota bacterium]